MDDTVPKEDSPPDFNKIDLSQLQGFSFGTQWTQDKSGGLDKRDRQPDRDDRRPNPGDGPADRRDRRAFRKPNVGSDAGANPSLPRRSGAQADPARRTPAEAGARQTHSRVATYDRNPYDSPFFTTTFYPDDATFDALVKTVRTSCRTIELFEIARTILGKLERFTLHVARRSAVTKEGQEAPAPAAPQVPIYISVPDGMPFDTEDAAISHVLSAHLGAFFDKVEAEVEPPKGNFQVVNRCGVTGELLGPPNYHRYSQIMQQHHAANLGRMPFDAYRARIETVRDPEAIQQWLEKMKKVTRYVWKSSSVPQRGTAADAAPTAVPQSETAPGASANPSADPSAEAVAKEETPLAPAITFDSFEDAQAYVLAHARDRIVRAATHARIPGRDAESIPSGEIRRAAEGALERQRRFPLETANALRGRLRREHFTIFKKGTKGISYVCAVKRKFRVPGQAFSENIGALISFIEAHPLVKAGELANGFLRISEDGPEAAPLTVEQREKIARLQGDLVWLVREGYVTEFIDGGLYAPPPLPEARKKEAEHEEHDPENFPEPAAAPAVRAATETEPPENTEGDRLAATSGAPLDAEELPPAPVETPPASP